MLQESPRIAQLRRRVHADPASIAFAQLAEEYRRAGHYHEAVKYCRTGLARHPGYLSARVTLGRSLIELGELDDAAREFELVLRSAPDNLAAIRGMAEIHQRRGAMGPALEFYKRALALARFDPELEESVTRIVREMGQVGAGTLDGLSFDEARTQLLSAPSGMPASNDPQDPAATATRSTGAPGSEPLIDFDALLASLGVPNASPPPVMDMLLSGSRAAPLTEPVVPALADTMSDDPFAVLERHLHAVEERAPAQHAQEEKSRVDDRVVQELEDWLRVLGGNTGPSPTA